jgi:hypothetical protein
MTADEKSGVKNGDTITQGVFFVKGIIVCAINLLSPGG